MQLVLNEVRDTDITLPRCVAAFTAYLLGDVLSQNCPRLVQ